MRYRHWERVEWVQGEGDLFETRTDVSFCNYVGKGKAYIYIPNVGYKTVPLDQMYALPLPT